MDGHSVKADRDDKTQVPAALASGSTLGGRLAAMVAPMIAIATTVPIHTL